MVLNSKFTFHLLKKYEFVLSVITSIGIYLVFYSKFLIPGFTIWSSDSIIKHFPSRWYLYNEIIVNHRFPFWTEKMFGGFPIYADSELGFLNPVNIIYLLLFGPEFSMELLHFSSYLIGSISIYILLKRFRYSFISYLVSITIFYFSYFMLNHIFHINLIYIVFLFPLNLLISHIAVEKINRFEYKNAVKYFFLNGLVFAYGFYWGHYQTSLLIFLSVLIFHFSYLKKISKVSFSISFTGLFFTGITAIILSLPQTLPTYDLYSQSKRNTQDRIEYYQGTPSPTMLTLFVYPQIWGDFKNYEGKKIDGAYSYTEMYVYLGISMFIILFFSIILMKRIDSIEIYFYTSFLVFILLTFSGFIPGIDESSPIISSFRYWIRSVVILIMPSSLIVAKFFSYELININIKNVVFKTLALAVPVASIFVFAYWNPKSLMNYNLFREINYEKYIQTNMFDVWFTIILLTLTLVLSKFFVKKRLLNFIHILLFFLVLFDYRYFGDEVLLTRSGSIPENQIIEIPENIEKSRIIFSGDSRGFAQMSLYQNSWSPMGYSQYAPNKYISEFKKIDLNVTRSSGIINTEDLIKYKHNFNDLGISGFYDVKSNVLYPTSFDNYFYNSIFKNNQIEVAIKSIEAEEGNINFIVDSPKSQNMQTNIRYFQDMDVFIDDIKINKSRNGLFIDFKMPEGSHKVNIKYVPRLFQYGVAIMGLYLLLITFIFCLYSETFLNFLRIRKDK